MWVFEKLRDSLRKRSEVWAFHMVVGLTCVWDLTHLHGLSETEIHVNGSHWIHSQNVAEGRRCWCRYTYPCPFVSYTKVMLVMVNPQKMNTTWWLKESWNISNKKNSVYEADVVLSNKIERKKAKLMDVVQKLRKDTKMHLLLTPKQNKLQQRLSLVERGKACLKQLCWLILRN